MNHKFVVWQLADSAFPCGRFAHAGNLEAARQSGMLKDVENLNGFAQSYQPQIGHGSPPLRLAAHWDRKRVDELDASSDALLADHVTNRARRANGQGFFTSGGDKIPRTGGPGITQSDRLVIDKTDLAEAVGNNRSVMERDSQKLRGDGPVLFAQIKHGKGVDEIVDHVLSAWKAQSRSETKIR